MPTYDEYGIKNTSDLELRGKNNTTFLKFELVGIIYEFNVHMYGFSGSFHDVFHVGKLRGSIGDKPNRWTGT